MPKNSAFRWEDKKCPLRLTDNRPSVFLPKMSALCDLRESPCDFTIMVQIKHPKYPYYKVPKRPGSEFLRAC
jgi:hypothetical protein